MLFYVKLIRLFYFGKSRDAGHFLMNDEIVTIIRYYVQTTYIIFSPYVYVDLLTVYSIPS
jgi:hypothetical protein